LRTLGAPLKFGCDILIGPGRGLGEVPGAPIGIELWIGRLRQCLMGLAAFARGGRPVDRRTDEWMTKGHLDTEFHQPLGLGGIGGLGLDPEPVRRPPQQRRVAERLRCREQQQPARGQGKRRQPPREAVLDATGQRREAWYPEPARQLRRRQPPRQFQQRQRVAVRLSNDPIAHPLIQRPADHRGQQRPRIIVTQTVDHKLRKSHEIVFIAGLAHDEDQGDRLGHQTAGNKCERLSRGPIQPLRVVYQT
jgi:hypothetical protein